ncbi:hypothetical protein JCM8547_008839 [Rhodosporidiobolus lusitaniae]
MEGPTTPPRKLPQRRTGQGGQLHKRAASKVTLTITPSTPPNSTRMHGAAPPSYRLLPESPSAPRTGMLFRKPPSSQDPRQQPSRGMWTRRRIVLLSCVAVGLLLLAGRSRSSDYSADWFRSSSAEGEVETYGRAQAGREAAASGQGRPGGGAGGAGKGGKEELVWHEAPLHRPPPAPGAGPPPDAHKDRIVKVHGGRPGKVPVVPVLNDEQDASVAPPAHDLEVTSATDPDASRKFLLVGWMGEQETKAQTHLYGLGLLALSLNRTLVLPGVKRSRFGTCYQNPFSLYYAADTLSSFGFPYVTSDEFWAWTEHQRSAPTAQVFTLARGAPQPVETVTMPPERMCLSGMNLDFSQHEPVAFFSPLSDWKSEEARNNLGEEVVTTLLDPPSSSSSSSSSSSPSSSSHRSPAVLVAHMNLRYPFLTPSLASRLSPFSFPLPYPYSYFPYSPHWTSLGHSIASHLSPFVAVHWRTETLEVDRIASCGTSLVEKLREVRRKHPEVETLYLATDYPIEILREEGGAGATGKATAHSGTMTKTLTEGHHAAMRAFLEQLEAEEGGAGMRLTSFLKEQKEVEWPSELTEAMRKVKGGIQELDGAIVGIVDKIVLMKAELFYAGFPVSESLEKGCGKLSQFTTQVISGRRDALRLDDSRMWNEAGHFMLDADAADEERETEEEKRMVKEVRRR